MIQLRTFNYLLNSRKDPRHQIKQWPISLFELAILPHFVDEKIFKKLSGSHKGRSTQ